MKIVYVKNNQTLFDISLQEYGDIKGVIYLVQDNNLNGILDNVNIGQELKIREIPINIRMKNYLKDYTIGTLDNSMAEGVGFWVVGEHRQNNFIVS